MGGNALKAEKWGWEWVGGGHQFFSEKNISSIHLNSLHLFPTKVLVNANCYTHKLQYVFSGCRHQIFSMPQMRL